MKRKIRNSAVAWLMVVPMVATTISGATNVLTAYAQTTEIGYSFVNTEKGFAEGTITINSPIDGNYYLYFADDNAALDGYYEIAQVNVEGGAGSFSFSRDIAIPVGATKVIAFRSTTEPTDLSVKKADAVYSIPESKQNPNSILDRTLSFEALSDTQLDYQSTVFYTMAEEHFAMALKDAAEREVDFVTTSGDCINNYEDGTSKEWQNYQRIIAESPYTGYIFETNGNHSMKSDIEYGLQAFTAATGLGDDSTSIGDKPYYEITAKNGDHFIFVALMGNSSVTNIDEFPTEELDWLEGLFEKYYGDGHNIFVFEHAFFQGWGPGDDKVNGVYNGGLRYSSEYPNNRRFKELFDKYKEVFLYTGHSHFDFMYNWNYDNENGQTANMFHIPATACTTHVTNGKSDYTMNFHDSQCYIVDVYPDMVISNGLNVVDNKIYPAYSYIVKTSDFNGSINGGDEDEPEGPYVESDTLIDVQIVDETSGKYLVSAGAVLFLYNNDSGNYFQVDSETLIAKIPENAKNLSLYRCNGEWGVGTKNDDYCPGFYNVFGPYERSASQVLFRVASSSKPAQNYWMEGTIDYGEEAGGDEGEDEGGQGADTHASAVTVRWAIPSELAIDEISYKILINNISGNYGDKSFTKTETTFTKSDVEYTVYEYVIPQETVEDINTKGGITRIQIKGKSSVQVVLLQYGDKSAKIADASDLENKIALPIGVTWDTSTKASTTTRTFSSDFVAYPVEPDVPRIPDVIPEGYIKVHIVDNTSSKYVFGSGAKVFVYDTLTAEHYEVFVDETGVEGDVVIPDSVTSMIVYRCNGEWAVGGSDATKNDNGICYWNKWVTAPHKAGWDKLVLGGYNSSDSSWAVATEAFETTDRFYLEGYFNGHDYYGTDYRFDDNGELEMTFNVDSYAYIKTSKGTTYKTNGWLGMNVSGGTMYLADTLSAPEKLYVPAGKIKFKLTTQEDGSILVKYEILHMDVDKSEIEIAGNEEPTPPQPADVSTLDALVKEVGRILSEDYRYASYMSYADLKRAYFEYVEAANAKTVSARTASARTTDADVYAGILGKYNAFCKAKEENNIVTVYFCNDIPWTSVNVYAYSSETGKGINSLNTACGMTLIKTLDCGIKIYEVTLNQSIFDKVVFTNGDGKKTVALDVPEYNHTGFYFSDVDYTQTELTPARFTYTYDKPATMYVALRTEEDDDGDGDGGNGGQKEPSNVDSENESGNGTGTGTGTGNGSGSESGNGETIDPEVMGDVAAIPDWTKAIFSLVLGCAAVFAVVLRLRERDKHNY